MNDRLRVRLGPSRWLAAAVLAGHGAALAAAALALPVPATGIVAAGLVLSAFEHVRRALLRSPLAIAGLELEADGRVAVCAPAGHWAAARVLDAAVPASWLAIVVLRDALDRRRTAVVLPDAVEAEAFRRLRVWLRWRPPPAAAARNNPTQR